MIRKFNYTKREKINITDIRIELIESKPYRSFTANITLGDYNFQPNSKIYIEAYSKAFVMRFFFGEVSNIQTPANTILSELPKDSMVLFKLKVVDESGYNGRIVGFADRIKPCGQDDDKNKKSILLLDFNSTIDPQIFKLTIDNEDLPKLEINNTIPNIREIVRSNRTFHALVFPVVIRQIAERIGFSKDEFDRHDGSWQDLWLTYFKESLNCSVELEGINDDEITHWADEIVSAFCRKEKVKDRLFN
jgi:hypothetical protein